MEATRQSLFDQFQLLNDGELLAEFRSGELTDLAKSIAGEELERRGIKVSEKIVEPRTEDQDTSEDEALVPIARLFTAEEAEMLKARLEIEGVPAIVADAQTVQMLGSTALAFGGVRVLVPESFVDRALEIFKSVENGDFALRE
jgi:hypothetical protein